MSKLIFLLILFVFVLILSATPLFRKSRSQREYESSGMQLLATSRGRVLLLPALGCLCACIVTFFMVLMYQDIGFEASDIGSLLSCIGVTILLVVVCFLGGYAMQARHVLYNEEILLIGKPFRPYQTIHWYEISEMRIKNQDFFDLYDRNGRRCVSANANLEGYRQFYQASLRFTRPEYTAKQKNTPYDNPVSAASGCGTLRYRTGEYYALLILYAVVMFLFFGLTVFSGEMHFGNAADHPRRKALRRPFLSGRVCRHRSGTVLCQSAENHLRPRKNCYFPFPPPDTNPAAPGYPPA